MSRGKGAQASFLREDVWLRVYSAFSGWGLGVWIQGLHVCGLQISGVRVEAMAEVSYIASNDSPGFPKLPNSP